MLKHGITGLPKYKVGYRNSQPNLDVAAKERPSRISKISNGRGDQKSSFFGPIVNAAAHFG
jgi:hypothetical protein